eukprot:8523126-Alexandrium_andersonii.AAC.1
MLPATTPSAILLLAALQGVSCHPPNPTSKECNKGQQPMLQAVQAGEHTRPSAQSVARLLTAEKCSRRRAVAMRNLH